MYQCKTLNERKVAKGVVKEGSSEALSSARTASFSSLVGCIFRPDKILYESQNFDHNGGSISSNPCAFNSIIYDEYGSIWLENGVNIEV